VAEESVAASDLVAGVNGRVQQAQALFTALAVAVGSGCTKVLRRARSPISEAQPAAAVARSERESTSWGIWKPGILPRVRGLPRLPGFQIFSSSPRRRPRRARPGGGRQPGERETWNAGSPRGRGVGRVDRARWCSGVPAWGALGRRPWPPPWPGRARPRGERRTSSLRACTGAREGVYIGSARVLART